MEKPIRFARKAIVCFGALCLLLVGGSVWTYGELITIDFDWLPDQTPVENFMPVTDAYAEYGVKFYCLGLFPDFWKDYTAYAYEDPRALSENNVIGPRIIGDYYHWLNFNLGYGVAEFSAPTDYVSLYGVGDPFQVFAYDQNNRQICHVSSNIAGTHHPSGLQKHFLEIDAGDTIIKTVEFGSLTGSYYTYFDDMTFNMPSSVPVIDRIDPRSCSPGQEIRIIGFHFGDIQGASVVHIAKRDFDATSSRINLWSDTEIRIIIPDYQCKRFKRRKFIGPRVQVTVNGVDSNKEILRVSKPTACP